MELTKHDAQKIFWHALTKPSLHLYESAPRPALTDRGYESRIWLCPWTGSFETP